MADPSPVAKEMGITRAEFLRTLARAFPEAAVEVDGDSVGVVDGVRRLDITLSAESERRIALMRLPTLHVRLAFAGYGAAEAAEALARFDRAFQRGGG